jgi:hypothetical protein
MESTRESVSATTLFSSPSYDSLATPQKTDDELKTLLTALQLEQIRIPGTALHIYCDTSTGRPRPYVPFPLRLQIFQPVRF